MESDYSKNFLEFETLVKTVPKILKHVKLKDFENKVIFYQLSLLVTCLSEATKL